MESGYTTTQIWDAKSCQPIGPPLKQEDDVSGVSFSPDGTRLLTTSRVWDVRTGIPLAAESAETLTAFCAGVKLDPELGSLRFLSRADRMALREKLAPLSSTSEDWRFVMNLSLPRDPRTSLASPRMALTNNDAVTRLIEKSPFGNIFEAAACDPSHPLLTFAYAVFEVAKNPLRPADPARAAWLCDYGMKRLPANMSATDLRAGAKLVEQVAGKLPEQKKHVLTLLDRARDK